MTAPRRIAVVGASCSGKSTLARALAERLGVPHVELDSLVHGPGWTETTDAELRAGLAPFLEGQGGWVIDGNYERKLGDAVLERADAVVWLDLPLATILRRLWRRTSRRIRTREELWNGNRESWRNAFVGRDSLFAWTIRAHRRLRRRMPGRLARPALRHLTVAHLRSPAEMSRWLAQQDAD